MKKPEKTQRIAVPFLTKQRLKIAAEKLSKEESKQTIGGLATRIINEWLDKN